MDVLDSLGEDLVLLSVSPADGRVTTAQQLGFGLMGSELVRLAAAGRLTITGGRVDVIDPSPGPDPLLDAALASLAGARRGVRAKAWVSRPRRGIAEAYLERLAAAGVLRAERRTRLGIFPTQAAIDAATSAAVAAATEAAHSAAHGAHGGGAGGGHGH